MPIPALALLSLLLAADPAPPSPFPPAIQKLLDRELAAPLAAKAFSTPGGAKGKVEAAAAPEVGAADEGRELLTVSLGSAQAMGCTLIPERIDAGAALAAVTQAAAERVQLAGVRAVDVQAVEGSALLHFEVLYTTSSAEGKLLGLLKVAVLPHDTHSFVCQHDELGYSRTFQRVTRGLAASLKSGRADARAKGRLAEIQAMHVEKIPVGYEERVLFDGEGGTRTSSSWSSMVLPRTPVDYVAVDNFRGETIDAEGLLVTGSYVQVLNGQVETQVSLKRDPETGEFVYQGKKGGKEISGRFPAKDGLATEFWFARRFDAKRGFGPTEPVKHDTYLFNADPTASVEMTYRKDAKPRRVEIVAGPMRLAAELDDAGLVSALETPMGPATMRVRRVWSRGAP